MLPVYIISKYNIRPSSGVLLQWLNISMRLCSSSDSSDSSDSDSDTEKVKQRTFTKSKLSSAESINPTTPDSKDNLGNFLNNMIKTKTVKLVTNTPAISSTEMKSTATTAGTGSTDLNEFVNNMLKARKIEKTINVAMQPKKKMPKKVKPISYEKQLASAAEDVANKLGGNKAKITSDLLQKFHKDKAEVEEKDEQLKSDKNSIKSDINLMEYIKSKQVARSKQLSKNEKQESSTSTEHLKKKSVINVLLQDYKKQAKINSISQQLQKTKTSVQQMQNYQKKSRQDLNLWNGIPSKVFENMGDVLPNTPELKTWAALEQRELKALTTYTPANIFQEMILWTEQGKLWKFPIDNEQGMEEEQNIHFSEHVFTERYLKGWCPTSGPIRHFMELVCVGLSKNPYMTVQEKINHIMWYRDYFKSKEELLQELGAINEPFPDTTKQITQ